MLYQGKPRVLIQFLTGTQIKVVIAFCQGESISGGAVSDYFIGEIRAFSFNWGACWWALCNGATLQMQQNQALGALIGKTYGGNGTTNFNLPDLQGRAYYGAGRATSGSAVYSTGATGGVETFVLSAATTPLHTHTAGATTSSGSAVLNPVRSASIFARTSTSIYAVANGGTVQPLNAASLGNVGANQGHANMQPFAVVNFCISLAGLWPPRQ